MKIRSQVKAGGVSLNHNESLKVRSTVSAGKLATNHNDGLRVRSRRQGREAFGESQ